MKEGGIAVKHIILHDSQDQAVKFESKMSLYEIESGDLAFLEE